MGADDQPEDVLDAPAPELSEEQVRALVGTSWGREVVEVGPLAAERDANFLLDDRYVLKVSNRAEPPAVVEMENVAMTHAAAVDPGLPLPTLVRTVEGAQMTSVVDAAGARCPARLITVVPGKVAEGRPVSVDLAERVGALTARTSIALEGLFHPAGGRALDWDVRRAPEVLAGPGVLAGLGGSGARLAEALPRISEAVRATTTLRGGLNHADITLTNVLVDPTGDEVTGVIDFGDMHHTAHVCDLAVALTSVLRNTAESPPADTWELAAAFLNGYQRHRLLTRAEVDLLPDLVLARLGLSLAISGRRSATHAANVDYIGQWDASSGRLLAELTDLDGDHLGDRVHRLAGTVRARPGRPAYGDTARLLRRRREIGGGTLSPLFYSQPLHVTRGEGPWLFTADGTRYLDAYNNVAVVGHAHPVVVQAVSRQMALLNTHSRYLHHDIVELSERILATMPAGLDTILFTTSGTEANELAWRMATAATGGNAAIVGEHAYHGSSGWMADLSPLEWPAGHRPRHVGTFAAPRSSAGGTDHATAAARVVAAGDRLAGQGDRPALVLADLGFTSEGVLDAPDEYVAGLVDGAHRSGALFLADEVQAGFGRFGPALWRFAVAGVTPDLVTLGKPMGAGYPIGAVVTRREVADTLGRDHEYFSTFAASAVAAASGLAVLDVLESERLPEQAVRVGEHLRHRLRDLARSDPRLGEVRGTGLLAGVDVLGADPGDLQRRRTFAVGLLDALCGRRVLAGLTGPDGAVLKIRPPLVWREQQVEVLVDALAAALSDVR